MQSKFGPWPMWNLCYLMKHRELLLWVLRPCHTSCTSPTPHTFHSHTNDANDVTQSKITNSAISETLNDNHRFFWNPRKALGPQRPPCHSSSVPPPPPTVRFRMKLNEFRNFATQQLVADTSSGPNHSISHFPFFFPDVHYNIAHLRPHLKSGILSFHVSY